MTASLVQRGKAQDDRVSGTGTHLSDDETVAKMGYPVREVRLPDAAGFGGGHGGVRLQPKAERSRAG